MRSFCKANSLPYISTETQRITQINGNLYIERGIGAVSSVQINDRMLLKIKKVCPDIVLTVFDMDSPASHNESPLTREELLNAFGLTHKYTDGTGIVFKWLPVAWCAETVALLSYIEESVKLVNDQTWKYHATLLAIINNLPSSAKAKILRNYIKDTDVVNIVEKADKQIHYLFSDYSKCGYDYESCLHIVEDYNHVFYEYQRNTVYFEVCGVRLNNHDSLYTNKSRFKSFPSTFK